MNNFACTFAHKEIRANKNNNNNNNNNNSNNNNNNNDNKTEITDGLQYTNKKPPGDTFVYTPEDLVTN